MTQDASQEKDWYTIAGNYAPLAIAAVLTLGSAGAAATGNLKMPGEALPEETIKSGLVMAIPKIKSSEGFRAKPYDDRTGVMTIGYGETRKDIVAKGLISEPEAANLMADRLERDFLRPALAAIPSNTRNKLTTGQVAAIASFSYNTGIQGFKDSSFGSNLINGDVEGAAKALPNSYVNPGTKVEAGLRNRRRDELKMFNRTK